MRKHTLNTYLLYICILFFAACKKEKTDPIPTPYPHASAKKAYAKKWNVTSALKVAKINSDPQLQSIEFMLNSFVIIYSNDSLIMGDYLEQDENTIILNGFGILEITQINSNSFSFTITPTGNPTITVSTIVANLVTTGDNTNYLCNTWKIISASSTDPTYQGIPAGLEGYMSFSQYGTYLTRANDNGNISHEYGVWSWNNTDQTSFCVGDISDTCTDVWNATFSDGSSKLDIVNNGQNYSVTYKLEVQ